MHQHSELSQARALMALLRRQTAMLASPPWWTPYAPWAITGLAVLAGAMLGMALR